MWITASQYSVWSTHLETRSTLISGRVSETFSDSVSFTVAFAVSLRVHKEAPMYLHPSWSLSGIFFGDCDKKEWNAMTGCPNIIGYEEPVKLNLTSGSIICSCTVKTKKGILALFSLLLYKRYSVQLLWNSWILNLISIFFSFPEL